MASSTHYWGDHRPWPRLLSYHMCMCMYTCIYIYIYVYVCVNIYICLYCMFVQFVSFRIGERGWGGSTSLWERLLLGVGGYFDRRKYRGVVCAFPISTRVGVYVGACVYIRTHTHTHCTDRVLGCKPRGRDELPGGPEESSWTKSRHISIRICVQSTHVYVYARRRDEILD